MIVICTRCQARFRVSDEKVGARGARIRCSRCQTLFAVGPATGTTGATPLPAPRRPATEVELETPIPAAPPDVPADDPFAGFRLDAGPPFGPPSTATGPSADPFGADLGAGLAVDPLAAGGTAQVARLDGEADRLDPAWADARAGGDADPAGAGSGSPDAEPAWADDPFAAALSPRADPPRPSERSLPLTDLADLLGEGPRPPAVPPPLPSPRASTVFAGEPGPGAGPAGPDLALEEPVPPAAPLRGAGDDPLGGFPFPPREEPFAPGPSELGAPAAPAGEPLALATEPLPGLPEMWRTSAALPPEPEEEPAATTAPVVPELPAPPPRGQGPGAAAQAPASPAGGRSALRSVAVNAVSLAALLVVALAFRVLWRGEGAVGAAAASPASLLRAIGVGDRPSAPLETAGVTTGRYPRATGAPLLFVRGEVISRSPAPLARVRVDVEVVRAGRVVAARSGLAGAVPTAEELHGVTDAAALEALSSAIAPRARGVRPGEPVPFLVAFTDVPEDLTGASVRVVATPAR